LWLSWPSCQWIPLQKLLDSVTDSANSEREPFFEAARYSIGCRERQLMWVRSNSIILHNIQCALKRKSVSQRRGRGFWACCADCWRDLTRLPHLRPERFSAAC